MKKFQIVALFITIFLSQISNSSDEGKNHSNTITNIYSINNSVILMFEKDLPVCNYAPANYEESKNSSRVHRYFMPHTDLADGINSTLNMRESDGGIEVVFYGKEVSKHNGTRMISFHVTM